MKKWFFNLIFIASVISGYTQNISGKVVYSIIPAELDNTIPNSPMGKATQQELKNRAEKQLYILDFNNSISKFEKQKILEQESDENENRLQKLTSIKYGARGVYFYDRVSNNMIMKLDDGTLLNKKEKSEWVISNESKQLGDYLCYKATCERKYVSKGEYVYRIVIAWFAPTLPYSYGPKDFNGLPGLILELQERKTTYLATNIHLNKDKELDIKIPKGKMYDSEEYNKKLKAQTGM